ncbi:inositol monophosphatase [Erythrobacter sp. SDW2]|nr:inositol monophosphatase family protein [Erythrobacter sp. SDW2]UIP05974.1 inositol monophosphatase [Erythrobacter sp. SDW2]
MSTLDREILALMQRVSRDIILPRYRNLSAGQIIEKAHDDLVTIADREAENALSEGLATIDPSLAIVGEEAAHADPLILNSLSTDCWIIDPIDGTHNFAHAQGPFGILLARASGGESRSGWIYDCLTGRFCAAHSGRGAFVNGERVRAASTGEQPPVAAISVIFLDPVRRAAVAEHIAPHYHVVETPRCAAEQYPRLALGQNDVSFFERTLAWDHAAGALWVNEAGGKVARPDGSPYRVNEYHRTGMIGAATPKLWDDLATHYARLG